MAKYVGWIALVIVVALVIIFWKQIAAFFSPSKEGKICTTNGNAGTIKNGVCVQNPPAEGSACMIGGRPGTIINGACVVNASAQRIILIPQFQGRNVPANTSNAKRIQSFINGPNVNPATKQSACTVAQDWCASEYSNTGNTNGFYCKVWKAGCLSGSN